MSTRLPFSAFHQPSRHGESSGSVACGKLRFEFASQVAASMTIFEYIMVMVSIILALALAQLLRAATELITSTGRYWVHMIWVVFLILLVLQFWWAYWDFNSIQTWSFDAYLSVLLPPTLVFLLACLLVPAQRSENTDWKAYFRSISRWFYSILFLVIVAGITVSVLYLGAPLLHPYRAFQAVFLALAIAGLIFRSDIAQGIVAIGFLSVLLVSQVVVRMYLGALAAE